MARRRKPKAETVDERALTRRQLAARFGVDIRTITNWVADGMRQHIVDGEPTYDWLECLKWREQKIRDDSRALRHAGGSTAIKNDMAEARLRALLAEAEQAEFELARIRAETLTVGYVAMEWERISNQLRAKMLAIAAEWPEFLIGCTTVLDFQKALRERVNVLLPMLDLAIRAEGEIESLPARKRKTR